MFETNVLGLCMCTREAVQDMLANKVDGHVVHINSIAGHKVTQHDPPSASVYPASKHAVTALTESLRQEMVWLKSHIKVSVSRTSFIVIFIMVESRWSKLRDRKTKKKKNKLKISQINNCI